MQRGVICWISSRGVPRCLISSAVASNVWHGALFPPEAPLSGHNPKRTSYESFWSFNDPDRNAWLVQEVTTRLPGRI